MRYVHQPHEMGDVARDTYGDDALSLEVAGRLRIGSCASRVIQCAILSSAIFITGLFPEAQVRAADAKADGSGSSQSEGKLDFLPADNPGSIVDNLKEGAERKDHLFQFPGVDRLLKPWYDWKAELARDHGFTFGIAFTHLYQWASDTVGPEDEASGFDFNIDGAWTFLGRGTNAPATLGFQILYRDPLRQDFPPLTFFTQTGSLYSGGVAYGETELSIAQLYLQKRFENNFGFRVGKIFPITAYDFFPFKNFRTDFTDFNHATNAAIPLPDYGLGGYLQYRPQRNVYLRLGAHDANADVEESGFDTYDDELFTILEIGVDPGLKPRVIGRPPFGDIHLSLWHQDERDEAGVDDAWGVAVSATQRFGRFAPFARYGYSDGDADGPTPVKHMANVGLVTDGIFGQANDRIGVGLTWTDPADSNLDEQSAFDAYYRVHVTPQIAITPTVQVIFDPVNNPDDDTVVVGGIRTRFEF